MGCVSTRPSTQQGNHDPSAPTTTNKRPQSNSISNASNNKDVISLVNENRTAPAPPMGLLSTSSSQSGGGRRFESNESNHMNQDSNMTKSQSSVKKAHRVNVFTKGYEKDSVVFQKQVLNATRVVKTAEEMDSIIRVLDSCYVFASCSMEQKEELAQYMFPINVANGETVINEGDSQSDFFYAIHQGTFEFYVGGHLVAKRSGNSNEPYFGELALLFNSPRQATAICSSCFNETDLTSSATTTMSGSGMGMGTPSNQAQLWAIGRDTFRQVVAFSNELRREERRAAVQSIAMLKENLSEEQLNRVIEAVNLFHFRAGQRIVRKGDPGDSCYFIKQGQVLCTKIGEDQLGQVELGPGSFFGERALLRDEPRAADVTAITDVIAMALDRKSFDELLGPLRSVMDDKMKERVVEALPILKELNPRLRREVIADFELETFRAGDVIVRAGDSKCDKFYVVRAGAVDVMDPHLGDDSGPIATLKEGSWFGEMALLNDQPRVATCIAASTRVECFVLRRATFQQLCVESKILAATSEQRRQSNFKRRLSDANSLASGTGSVIAPSPSTSSLDGPTSSSSKAANGLDEEHSPPNTSNSLVVERVPALRDLEKLHIVGKGTFGTVFLVQEREVKRKSNNNKRTPPQGPSGTPLPLFALKMMNKHNLVRCEQKLNVVNEKRILADCGQHPFVLKMYATYQDVDSLYFLLEFVPGGELFSIMQDKFRFPLYPTMFYAACIADVLEHIHMKGVVYRDLKPENVLLDRFGYVKLADFGFAKKVADKTYTLCGTPEYLAPEVVLGTGHDKGVDWWGLGVLVYEMLVGISPFASEYDEHQQVVCNNIVKGRVHFDKMTKAVADTESKPDGFWNLPASPTYLPQQRQSTSNGTGLGGAGSNSPASRFSLSKSLRAGSLPVEDFVRKLLNKNPLQRLGNLKDGAKDVKRHPFFNDIQDWADLRARKIQAPFVPPLKSDDDVSRFDDFEPDESWPAYKGPQDWCAEF